MKRKAHSDTVSSDPDYDSDDDKLKTDRGLEKKVINALHANAFINCLNIKVRVSGRLVFLEGSVPFQKQRILAQQCVMDIFGIRSVINYLTYHSVYAQ